MTDLDDSPGIPLFTDFRGRPFNFKLLCDPELKARYKKLIVKHSGEVTKSRNRRLLLAPKNACEYLHLGCENHAPYTAAPIFNVTWVDHCISLSQVLDVKAYLLNPSPQFALTNFMEQLDDGHYQPPPPQNPIAECTSSWPVHEVERPFNGNLERHLREVKALCSRVTARSEGAGNLPDAASIPSPPSSDGDNQEETMMDCMEELGTQPSSTPRFPRTSGNNGGQERLKAKPSNNPSTRSLDLPLSHKRTSVNRDPGTAAVSTSSPYTSPPDTRRDPRLPPQSSNPVVTRTELQKSESHRVSISQSNTDSHSARNKKQPRRRELFDSENFAPGFSDDESEPVLVSRTPHPQSRAELNIDEASRSPPARTATPPPSVPSRVPPLEVQRNAVPRASTQTDSDNEFGPPPGSFVRVKGVRQNTRAPYTREEEITILRYLKAGRKLSGLRSNRVWVEMDGKPGLERRTYQSLKEHFLKKMLPNLERYKMFTSDEIERMRSTCC